MPEALHQPVLTFTKLCPTAAAPVPWPPGNRFSDSVRFSAYDVASWEDVLVQPQTMAILSTRLVLTLPEGSRVFTSYRSGERLPDGVDVLPREIESYELCDVPLAFWNRSSNPFQGTPSFSICFIIFLLSLVKAGVPICALVLDLGAAFACSCLAAPVRLVELKL